MTDPAVEGLVAMASRHRSRPKKKTRGERLALAVAGMIDGVISLPRWILTTIKQMACEHLNEAVSRTNHGKATCLNCGRMRWRSAYRPDAHVSIHGTSIPMQGHADPRRTRKVEVK